MVSIEEIAAFCKRKGFVYPSSEIYGGFAGFYDYGPIGVEIINNIKREWWESVVRKIDNVVGIYGSIITSQKVWIASGHASEFRDYLVICKCGNRIRADNLIEEIGLRAEILNKEEIEKIVKKTRCPKCGKMLKDLKEFNLMFKTYVGPGNGEEVFLRPETAQTIFINFKNIINTTRLKLPFGIAQIGKVFRNEISPRNFLFRMREFEQMEVEFFVDPEKKDECPIFDTVKDLEVNILTAKAQEKNLDTKKVKISKLYKDGVIKSKWHAFWIGYRYKWFLDLGINPKKLRVREHLKNELSHYSTSTFDIEYKFPFGWKEIEGIADRSSFDLLQHQKFSGVDLSYFDEEKKEKILPYVAAEPSAGVDRIFLAFIVDAYNEEVVKGEKRVVLKLNPKLAPYKVAVFPLVCKDGLPEKAKEVYKIVRNCFPCFYDEKGSIGRRYRRMDEIGTPYCITIDYQTMDDNTVTVRDRDTMKQERIEINSLLNELYKKLVR